MTDLLTTVVQSQELKQLAVPQNSCWFWVKMNHNSFDLDKYYLAYEVTENTYVVFGEKAHTLFHITCGREEMSDCISAFTSQEIWDMMKIENHYIEQEADEIRLMDEEGMLVNRIYENNDIDARFRMLVFLLTEKIWLFYELEA
jgi:hypothetical protein